MQLKSWNTKENVAEHDCPVTFDEYSFGVENWGAPPERGFIAFRSFVDWLVQYQVIGNIHDSPELPSR